MEQTPNFKLISYPVHKELMSQRHIIADILDIDIKDMTIFLADADIKCPLKYNSKKIRTIGFDDLPQINASESYKKQISNHTEFGLTIYKQLDLDITYAVYSTTDICNMATHTKFLIIKKGQDTYRLLKYIKTQSKCVDGDINTTLILDDQLKDKLVKNTISLIKAKRHMKEYNIKAKRGILLHGPPGNGKTMVCKWLKQLCATKSIKCTTITTTNIEEAFKNNRLEYLFSSKPILFCDDIDISYLNRKGSNGKISCAILSAMDGINETNSSIRIFTTNETLEDMDPAFKRPGRIDCIFNIDKPTLEQRKEFISNWHSDILEHLHKDGNMEALLSQTSDASYAELQNIYTILVTDHLLNNKMDINRSLDSYKDKRKADNRKVGF